jgi:hypothetical protein
LVPWQIDHHDFIMEDNFENYQEIFGSLIDPEAWGMICAIMGDKIAHFLGKAMAMDGTKR